MTLRRTIASRERIVPPGFFFDMVYLSPDIFVLIRYDGRLDASSLTAAMVAGGRIFEAC
jgi:hypothetical protein